MQTTSNSAAFIEAEQYSDMILSLLYDGLLPTVFYREVTDFANGSTLHIKTVGSVELQEAAEDSPLVYSPIESGSVSFRITEYVGDAWYVTDDLREDGMQIEQLMVQRAWNSTRAYQEKVETDFLKTCADVYTGASDPFNINGFAHKTVSAETNNLFAIKHLIAMRLAFTKANVPLNGRVFICDPVVDATLTSLVTLTSDITPFAADILVNGMAGQMQFRYNIQGFDIYTSNRLYRGAANDGTTSLADGVYNVFMCIADDNTKPIMHAVRRQPKVEGERNKDRARDEFVMRARYGFGVQRVDTLAVLITDPLKYE